MVLIVVRHTESQWNKLNKFTGLTDVDLSENGINDAHQIGKLLKEYRFHNVFTSCLKRTIMTAEIIASYQDDNPSFNRLSGLNERDYGDITGKNKSELANEHGENQIKIWRRSFSVSPPNGESLKDVVERVGESFDKIIKNSTNNNILIVAHGNSLRALFVHLGLKSKKEIETFEIDVGVPIEININSKSFSYINPYKLLAYQIIDSRGNPTIEIKCIDKLTGRTIGKGSSPSGASCGSSEAHELRDGSKCLFLGKSVYNAVDKANTICNNIVLSKKSILDLARCDYQMIKLDGTDMKTEYGGNTSTAFSFCIMDTASNLLQTEMYNYISSQYKLSQSNSLPTPFVNIINGGKHGVDDNLKIQEFMIFANEEYNTSKQIRIYCEVYHTLKSILVKKYGPMAKSIGDEGGFCPPISSADEALSTIELAINKAGYIVGKDVFMALDCAASEFYDENTSLYEIESNKFLNYIELIDYYGNLIEKHPALKSIEDGFHETDYEAWIKFTEKFSDKIMIVGDDLFTTNINLINRGLSNGWANALLLKVNQIGTVTEAINGAQAMMNKGHNIIVSHRSGETNHAYIVDLAIGIGAKYLKIGSPCRGERVAKFNRLLEIEASKFK